jgi:putative addiction module component (TIGR02574 family)
MKQVFFYIHFNEVKGVFYMGTNLKNQIKQLSLSERILLAEEIWNSIAEENQTFELTISQKEELDRRIDSLTENQITLRNWDEIRLEFLGR